MDFTALGWAVIWAGAAVLLVLRAPGPLLPVWRRVGLTAAAVPVLAVLGWGALELLGLEWSGTLQAQAAAGCPADLAELAERYGVDSDSCRGGLYGADAGGGLAAPGGAPDAAGGDFLCAVFWPDGGRVSCSLRRGS